MNLKEQIALAIFQSELSKESLPELGHSYKSLWRFCLEDAEMCVEKPITDKEDILSGFTKPEQKLIKLLIRENNE